MAASLSAMRSAATPEDRNGSALTLPPKVHTRGKFTRYIDPGLQARTLGELRERCGEYGEAAVMEARLSALTAWRMHGSGNARPVSILLFHEFERSRLRLPKHGPQPWNPRLADLPADEQAVIEAEVQRDLAEWEAAGSPGLPSAIESTQRRVHSAVVATEERRPTAPAQNQDPIEGEPECA